MVRDFRHVLDKLLVVGRPQTSKKGVLKGTYRASYATRTIVFELLSFAGASVAIFRSEEVAGNEANPLDVAGAKAGTRSRPLCSPTFPRL